MDLLKNLDNMITAEEFLNNQDFYDLHAIPEWSVKRVMIEFAKLHVTEALRKASEYAEITDNGRFPFIDKNSILNAYPLENIK